MPSHIFTRPGVWQESIAMNQRSAAAALKHPSGQKISMHCPHALDYFTSALENRSLDLLKSFLLGVVFELGT
jgi:hypothetical protein